MSKYTTELRFVVEQTLADRGLPNEERHWRETWKTLGLDDYPLFDEGYRETLNTKIIRHYYTREIGSETVGRFRMFVKDAMHLIMPYYNQLYLSEAAAAGIDPFKERDYTVSEKSSGDSRSGTQGTNTVDTTAQSVYSDTPQSELIPSKIRNMQYATNVTLGEDGSKSTVKNDTEGEFSSDTVRTESGRFTAESDLLKKWRSTFINIDREVVENVELAHCFMTIW